MRVPIDFLKKRGFSTELSTGQKITIIVEAFSCYNHFQELSPW